MADPWKTRALLDVEEIWPKVEDVTAALPPLVPPMLPVVPLVGMLKLGWFRTLNPSSRRVIASLS